MARVRIVFMGLLHGIFAVPMSTARAEAPPAAADQLTRGGRLYGLGCATAKCHGTQGEGIRSGGAFRVWPLVGADFQVRNPNAQVIFDVARSGNEQSLRAMTDQQIYDAVAYQLSLNGARPTRLLTEHNAATVLSGPAAGSGDGEIHPPPGNAVLLHPSAGSRAPSNPVANGYLRLQVDQMAQATAIGGHSVAGGGVFSVLVLAIRDLTERALALDPRYLRLRTATGARLEPRDVELEYPIERFHPQTITPGHGTAAVAVFALPAGATPAQLTYDDQTGHPVSVNLAR